MSTVTIQDLTRVLMNATPEEVAQFLEAWSAMTGKEIGKTEFHSMETPVTKKIATVKKEVFTVLPSIPSGSGIPTAESYRLVTVDHSVCMARSLKPAGEDKRWKPSVYAEAQCGGKVTDGSDLCTTCVKKMEKFAISKTAKSGWNGRLTESPPDYTHMLGTKWAAKCKWTGEPETETETETKPETKPEPEPESKPEVTEVVVEMPPKISEATKAKKAETAEAKKAEAEAKKVAVAEAKKAAAEAKKAEKAEKAEKVKKPAAKVPEVKATTTAAPATIAGELLTIGTDFYWVNSGNVYEYSLITEQQGDFVGRLRGDGTIDADGEENTVAESDSE